MTDQAKTATDEDIFLIPEPNWEAFAKKMKRVNNRAKKLKLSPMVVEELGIKIVKKQYKGFSGGTYTVEYRYHEVRVSGSRPQLNGWTLIGTISHEPGGNVFQSAPGREIPESFRSSKGTCNHCKRKRARRETMVISKDGETQQIGRNCLQDFIGDVDPKGVVSWYTMWEEIKASTCDPDTFCAQSDYVPSLDYLAAVACDIRHNGFMSAGKAKISGGMSTAASAWTILYPPTGKSGEGIPKIEEEDCAAAADILTWMAEDLSQREGLTDYLANLVAAGSTGYLRIKHAGLVASMFKAREVDLAGKVKADEKKAERATEKNEFFGDIRERTTWTFKVVRKDDQEGEFGCYTRILLKDFEGRVAAWNCSNQGVIKNLEIGRAYSIKGTVKSHYTWKNEEATKVTYLNRCIVGDEVAAS